MSCIVGNNNKEFAALSVIGFFADKETEVVFISLSLYRYSKRHFKIDLYICGLFVNNFYLVQWYTKSKHRKTCFVLLQTRKSICKFSKPTPLIKHSFSWLYNNFLSILRTIVYHLEIRILYIALTVSRGGNIFHSINTQTRVGGVINKYDFFWTSNHFCIVFLLFSSLLVGPNYNTK